MKPYKKRKMWLGMVLVAGIVAGFSATPGESAPGSSLVAPTVATFVGVTVADIRGAGVNVEPARLLADSPPFPSGEDLVKAMRDQGVRIVRLTYAMDHDFSLAKNGGWKEVFRRLEAGNIKVIVAMMTRLPDTCKCGVVGPRIVDLDTLIAREKEVLDHIRQQHDGAYPVNLVAIDVSSEPAINDPPTVSKLPILVNAMKEYSGLPVFIGGWVGDRLSGTGAGNLCHNGAVLGDVLSPHIYMGKTGVAASPPSLDPSTPPIQGIGRNQTAVTSPAFSPPAASVLYAIINANGPDSGTPQGVTGTVTSTGKALTWRLLVKSNAQVAGALGGAVEVWYAFNPDAQANIQVSAQLAVPASASAPDGYLQTLVFNNADPLQTGAAVKAVSTLTPQVPSATLKTTQINSWVWGVINTTDNDTVGTPLSGQSLSASARNTTSRRAWWTQRTSSGTLKENTSVTIGSSLPSVHFNMAAFEVLQSPTSGADRPGIPARDPSTPGLKGIGVGQNSVTSPPFSPPGGAVLYAVVVANGPDTGTPQSVTGVTSTGWPLNWQLLANPLQGTMARSNAQSPGALGGAAEVWWAYNPTPQAGITVTARLAVPSAGSAPDGFLQTLVVKNAAFDQTGAALSVTSSATPAVPSGTVTTAVPGAWGWGVVSGWSSATVGTPGDGQSLSARSQNSTTGKAWWSQHRKATTSWSPAAGMNVTLNDKAPMVTYNMVTFEVRPGPVTDPTVFKDATTEYLATVKQSLREAGCSALPPIFVGEYGAKSGVPPHQGPGTPQHQQAVIRGTYDALKAEQATYGITGALIWQVSPLAVQSRDAYALFSYAIAAPASCPGCITIKEATFFPAYFDLPRFTFP